jgi:hypothetical protein
MIPWLGLVAFHLVLALQRDRPMIFGDEAGYIGNARYFSGGLPIRMFQSGAYYPGYSLLITPLFWLTSIPQSTYQAILILNSVLLSTLYVGLLYWLRLVFQDQSWKTDAIALVAAIYPAFVLQAEFALAESAIILLHAAVPLAMYWLVRSRSTAAAVALALLAAFLFAVHPRTVATTIGVGTHLLLLLGLRLIPARTALAGFGCLSVGVWGARLLSKHVESINGGGSADAAHLFPDTLERAWTVFLEANGQLWYLGVASCGVTLLGLVHIVRELLRRSEGGLRWRDPAWHSLLLALVTFFGGFVISCLFLAPEPRADHMIYGRYNEGIVAPVLAAGIWCLGVFVPGWRQRLRSVLPVVFILPICAAVLFLGRGDTLSSGVNLANVLGIVPLLTAFGGIAPFKMCLLTLVTFAALSAVGHRRLVAALIPLGLVYFCSTLFVHETFLMRMQRGRALTERFLLPIKELPDVKRISYDASFLQPSVLFFAQYFFPQVTFDFFFSEKGELPKSTPVLANADWENATPLGARRLSVHRGGAAVWVVPVPESSCCPSEDPSFRVYGATPVPNVRESGFHGSEAWSLGAVRWTNGDAVLQIPLARPGTTPAYLYLDLASVGRESNELTISANDIPLFVGTVRAGRWRVYLPLNGIQSDRTLDVQVTSNWIVPAEAYGTKDKRRLGVAVHEVRLISQCCFDSGDK